MAHSLLATVEIGAGWSTGEQLVRFGLPLLLVLAGALTTLWGRREVGEARARAGSRGGFGGPPGTSDIGSAEGFGVEEDGPTLMGGRRKVLIGLGLTVAGLLLLLGTLLWQLLA